MRRASILENEPLLNFEWVMGCGRDSPRPEVKGGRSPAKRISVCPASGDTRVHGRSAAGFRIQPGDPCDGALERANR